MLQIAVFVDAGYVYAQGSALLSGTKQKRHNIELYVENILGNLRRVAEKACPNGRVLRVYWYDGLIRGDRLTDPQVEIANASCVKLRLGRINSKGQQKGVDSLIVTDLIELARNRVISDALIVSGDEDIRIGVQVAQTFGVQVHLLGIQPARGTQSRELIQEADTHQEWSKDDVRGFLRVTQTAPVADPSRDGDASQPATEVARGEDELESAIDDEISATIARLDAPTREAVRAEVRTAPGYVPSHVDSPTLARIGKRVGRDLTPEERKRFRASFSRRLSE